MKQHVKVFFMKQAELIGSVKGVGEVTCNGQLKPDTDLGTLL